MDFNVSKLKNQRHFLAVDIDPPKLARLKLCIISHVYPCRIFTGFKSKNIFRQIENLHHIDTKRTLQTNALLKRNSSKILQILP